MNSWRETFGDRLIPDNKSGYPIGGIIPIQHEKLTPRFAEKFVDTFCWPWNHLKKHSNDTLKEMYSHDSRIETINQIEEMKSSGFRVYDPPFDRPGKWCGIGINFHEPPDWQPWFNYDRTIQTIMCFEASPWDFKVYNRDHIYWFIDFMKRVFRFINPEFAWADHYDYLLKLDFCKNEYQIYSFAIFTENLNSMIFHSSAIDLYY